MSESPNEQLLAELRDKRVQLKQQEVDVKKEIEEVNSQIMSELLKTDSKSFVIGDRRLHISQPETDEYDWAGIKKSIGVVHWRQVVTEVPDANKLAQLVAAGKVKASVLAKHVSRVPFQKPRLRDDLVKKEADE